MYQNNIMRKYRQTNVTIYFYIFIVYNNFPLKNIYMYKVHYVCAMCELLELLQKFV